MEFLQIKKDRRVDCELISKGRESSAHWDDGIYYLISKKGKKGMSKNSDNKSKFKRQMYMS